MQYNIISFLNTVKCPSTKIKSKVVMVHIILSPLYLYRHIKCVLKMLLKKIAKITMSFL